ncbi:short-chain dehydrogenase/reductase SDR [Pseudomonas putida S11]|nr:short-chain dehydrogenase/reductase SDR [Pseudomonas putida S11]
MTRKIALITGASRGLGRNTAEHLAARGIDVIGTYHSKAEEADAVAARLEQAGVKAIMLQLDVSDSASFAGFAECLGATLQQHFGRERFDFLVNNAGIGLNVPYTETSEAQFDQLLNIQLKGPFFLTQRLLPLLVDNGRIVNISTGLARFALPGVCRLCRDEGGDGGADPLSGQGTGSTWDSCEHSGAGGDRDRFWRRRGAGLTDRLMEYIAGNTALGRVGLPDDIGAAIALLLEDGNGWINGQRLEVSGGMFL